MKTQNETKPSYLCTTQSPFLCLKFIPFNNHEMLTGAIFITMYLHVDWYSIHVIFCTICLIAGLLDKRPQKMWEKRQLRIENVTSLIFFQLDTPKKGKVPMNGVTI